MDGQITLESEIGKGSTFRVTLPLAEAAAAADVEVASAVVSKYAARVLLVEDDATVAAVIAGLLGASGYRVRHAENALGALSELASGTYDTVLIDLDLPGIDGLALARMIRRGESVGAGRRIVGVSARSNGSEEADCLAAGMDAFLRKPVTGKSLQDVVGESSAALAAV
jgi:CheY-like chemotaxis protein